MDLLIDPAPHAAPTGSGSTSTATDWRLIVRWALLGTVALLVLVMVDVQRGGNGNPVSLAQPGTGGSATALFAKDFPELEQPDADGLDGQIYYAIASDPMHLDETAVYLDHPRYRFQRPLLPWLAWAIHPTGGGVGLVLALFAVTLLGVFAGSVGLGALSVRLGGPAWAAALLAITPGAYWSLRVTVSDALALALAIAALALATRNRHGWAVAVGVLAVLAKEPAILVFAGWFLHRRTRRAALLAAIPGFVAAAWMAWLRWQLPPDRARSQDIDLPFVGLWQGWHLVWSHGNELVGMACTVGGLAIGGLALWRRGLRHPLGWIVALQLAFMLVMGYNPTSTNFGGTRMAMPIMVFGVLALLTPAARTDRVPRTVTPLSAE
ncbi:hypothetical protein BH10ACT1_BH10ACT1_30850 [soil metagenome]